MQGISGALLMMITVVSVLSINQNINPSVFMGRRDNFITDGDPPIVTSKLNNNLNYDIPKTANFKHQKRPSHSQDMRENFIYLMLRNEEFKVSKVDDINRLKRNDSSTVQAVDKSKPFKQNIKNNTKDVNTKEFQSRNFVKDGYRYTTPEETPYAVLIDVSYILEFKLIFSSRCSGTLLTPKWVLTAAHCVRGKLIDPKKDIFVYVTAGIYNEYRPTASPSSRQTRIPDPSNIYVHRQYNNQTTELRYDIALIDLSWPFNLTEAVGTIALSKEPWDFNKVEDCNITTFSHGDELDRYFYDRRRTTNYLRATSPCVLCPEGEANKEFMMCSIPKAEEYGLCMGAGGGALVCNGVIVAVASGVVPGEHPGTCDPQQEGIMTNCSDPALVKNSIGLFVQTYPYIDWITLLTKDPDLPTDQPSTYPPFDPTTLETDSPLTTSTANSYSLFLPFTIIVGCFLIHVIN